MGERTTYRGYTIYVTDTHFTAEAPDGYQRRFLSMSSLRAWVRKRERQPA